MSLAVRRQHDLKPMASVQGTPPPATHLIDGSVKTVAVYLCYFFLFGGQAQTGKKHLHFGAINNARGFPSRRKKGRVGKSEIGRGT